MTPYEIHLHHSDEDGGYIATVHELPGCSAFGETPQKAIKEIEVAAKLWLRAAKKEKRPIPEPTMKKKITRTASGFGR